MKHIIILGDGMADHAVECLGRKTLLQYADTEYMDMLARQGRTGRLITVPEGYAPGSEVANTAILGYDLDKVYEIRTVIAPNLNNENTVREASKIIKDKCKYKFNIYRHYGVRKEEISLKKNML